MPKWMGRWYMTNEGGVLGWMDGSVVLSGFGG